MSAISSAALRLRDLRAELFKLEQLVSTRPDDEMLFVNMKSKKRLIEELERSLSTELAQQQIEVCDYRLISRASEQYLVKDIAESVIAYQNVFSQVFDALHHGPKKRARLNPEAEKYSSLTFGYSYTGSLGMKFLLPSERGFFSGVFDEAISALYDLISVRDQHEVKDLAQILGAGVVKRLYDWAKTNRESQFDVDVSWSRSDGHLLGQRVSIDQMQNIEGIIEDTSDQENEILELKGYLIGGDLETRGFHFVVPNGENIRGLLSEDFRQESSLMLGDYYAAKIRKFRMVQYSTDTAKVWYELEQLQPAGNV